MPISILREASNEDLEPLVKYLTKPITEELSIKENYKKHYPNHREYVNEIAFELRLFGGNTIANIFREEGPPYEEIVQDVASKLNVDYADDDSVEEVELKILLEMLKRAFDKMSDAERNELIKTFEEAGIEEMDFSSGFPMAAIMAQMAVKSAGFVAYRIAVIVANAIARTVLGSGLSLAANATLTRALGVFAGPIGWAITGIWTIGTVSKPAYRVMIPCVCHIAYIRQKTKNQDAFGGNE